MHGSGIEVSERGAGAPKRPQERPSANEPAWRTQQEAAAGRRFRLSPQTEYNVAVETLLIKKGFFYARKRNRSE